MSFRTTLRASLPIALVWGVGWALFTFLVTTYNAWRSARLGYYTGTVIDHLFQAALGFGFGIVGGLIFSALLARAERGGEVGKMSYVRVALWGSLTGLCFVPALLGLRMLMIGEGIALLDFARMCLWFGGFGATGALAMLAVARKGAPPVQRPPAELGSDFSVAEFADEGVRLRDSSG